MVKIANELKLMQEQMKLIYNQNAFLMKVCLDHHLIEFDPKTKEYKIIKKEKKHD